MNKIEFYYRIGGTKLVVSKMIDRLTKREKDSFYEMLLNADVSDYPRILRVIYEENTGEKLDLDNPRTYREKMQWSKLFDLSPIKTELADKIKARDWVAAKIGEEYLIPVYGIWDTFDEIDFNVLPDSFVLKSNTGSGCNIIVKDKKTFDPEKAKEKFEEFNKMNFAFRSGFELQYKDIVPKVFAEKYMESEDGQLQDYKFLCFDGKPYYCWVDVDRFSKHRRRNVYDMNWKLQPWNQGSHGNTEYELKRPDNFEEMIEIATVLCEGFLHVRVDLYNVSGKVFFGEMTFSSSSGFNKTVPEEYDLMLGNFWKLPFEGDGK